MDRVQIYTIRTCPFCRMAKELLNQKGIPFKEVDVTQDGPKREWLVKITGYKTVPQVFINGKPIGGYEQLVQFLAQRG